MHIVAGFLGGRIDPRSGKAHLGMHSQMAEAMISKHFTVTEEGKASHKVPDMKYFLFKAMEGIQLRNVI